METPYDYVEQKKPVTDSDTPSREQLIETMYTLGKQGIILPNRIIFGDMMELLYITHALYKEMRSKVPELSKDEFLQLFQDCMYEELYKMHDGVYYDDLKKSLVMSSEIQESAIQQCFTAFEQELYFVCACGLLSLIEGVLAQYAQSANTRLLSLFKKIEEKINQDQNEEQILTSANIRGYIELLTKKSDFQAGIEPNELNRHWLLHGRSQRNIRKVDCLRLLITLSLVLEIE